MDRARSIAARFHRWLSAIFNFKPPVSDPRHALGRQGEDAAVRFLKRNGYKVLYRNFRAPRGGEVDIVCRDKSCDTLVFVEVKTRRSLEHGAPSEAVNREKQRLISKGALAWLRLLDRPDIVCRFDVVEVVLQENRPSFNLIQNAFQLSDPYIV